MEVSLEERWIGGRDPWVMGVGVAERRSPVKHIYPCMLYTPETLTRFSKKFLDFVRK